MISILKIIGSNELTNLNELLLMEIISQRKFFVRGKKTKDQMRMKMENAV